MLRINDVQKEFLRKPFSKPMKNPNVEQLSKSECKFIVIGDYSTYFFVKNDIDFEVCVVDYKTERKPVSPEVKRMIDNAMVGRKVLRINNPPGTVSDDAIEMVKKWIKKPQRLFVIVDGEDDLVALPFFLSVSQSYCIVYGIRDKGMVIKQVTEGFKRKMVERFKRLSLDLGIPRSVSHSD